MSAKSVVSALLQHSRNLLAQGNHVDAFASVLHAIKLTRGEEAIFDLLDQAKKDYEDRVLSEEMARIELEKAISATEVLLSQDSLLKEQGNAEILKDAFEDGSSIICKSCGGLIARHRWNDHIMFWCEND